MAEGIELGDLGRPGDEGVVQTEDVVQPENDEKTTSHISISPADAKRIRGKEAAARNLTGDSLTALRRELLIDKVDAFLNIVAERTGLEPAPCIYDEFVLGSEDPPALYLKDGLTRVTHENDSTKYRVLRALGKANFIRAHLFPKYTTSKRAQVTTRQVSALRVWIRARQPRCRGLKISSS